MEQSLEAEIIIASTKVLALLDSGKLEEAQAAVAAFDDYLRSKEKVADVNVDVLWIQTGIAVSNPDNKTYLRDVEDQLNGLVFEYFHKK